MSYRTFLKNRLKSHALNYLMWMSNWQHNSRDGFSFQVSNCLWTLNVTVLVIDMKHVEKRNEEFCCCDIKDTYCENSLSELGTCKAGKCDIFFNVTVSPCTESMSPGPCSISTDEEMDAEMFGGIGYLFLFTTTAQANNVRKRFCHHIYMSIDIVCYIHSMTIKWRAKNQSALIHKLEIRHFACDPKMLWDSCSYKLLANMYMSELSIPTNLYSVKSILDAFYSSKVKSKLCGLDHFGSHSFNWRRLMMIF